MTHLHHAVRKREQQAEQSLGGLWRQRLPARRAACLRLLFNHIHGRKSEVMHSTPVHLGMSQQISYGQASP